MIGGVHETVQNGVAVGCIADHFMMPLSLIGESLTLQSLSPTTRFLGAGCQS